mgnify:FL=1
MWLNKKTVQLNKQGLADWTNEVRERAKEILKIKALTDLNQRMSIPPSVDTIALDLVWFYRWMMYRKMMDRFGTPTLQEWCQSSKWGETLPAWRIPYRVNDEAAAQCRLENVARGKEDKWLRPCDQLSLKHI